MNNDNKNIVVAVIDFGSTSIKGALAEKKSDGSINILANAEEPSEGCILRGTIYNLENTAQKTKGVINKLEMITKRKISKVYANLGGQSLRTVQHLASLAFENPHEISEEDIENLREQVAEFTLPGYEVLKIEAPEYFVNRQYTTQPVGVQAMKLDARYKLIMAKPQKKANINNVLTQKLDYEIVDTFISPLVLSDTFLTQDNKKLGCALIDFGGGSTTICVYKNGLLTGIRVIPLGGDNITQDLTALHITPSEAERVKCSQGSCKVVFGDKTAIEVNTRDKLSTKTLSRHDVNRYIEARAQEIVDNVVVQLKKLIDKDELGGMIFVTGGGSMLDGLTQMFSKSLGMDVQSAHEFGHLDSANKAYISKPNLHLIYAMSRASDEDCLTPSIGDSIGKATAPSIDVDGEEMKTNTYTAHNNGESPQHSPNQIEDNSRKGEEQIREFEDPIDEQEKDDANTNPKPEKKEKTFFKGLKDWFENLLPEEE